LAEKERKLISQRTREALKAAKERGVTLGNPRLDEVRGLAVAATRAEADRYAANVLPIIREVQATGATSLRAIARARGTRRCHGAGRAVDAGPGVELAQARRRAMTTRGISRETRSAYAAMSVRSIVA
jgi:hypothetical protein